MHIVFVTTEITTKDSSAGGLGTFTSNMARLFQSKGHLVEVILVTSKETELELEGIPVLNVYGAVGRMVYVKNHELLIRILPDIISKKKVKLMLVGDGPLMDYCKQLAKELNVEKHILFIGRREDIPELLQAMDVYCMPSFFEGFSISLIEAQCAGLPCLISDKINNGSKVTNLVKELSLFNDKWIEEIIRCFENRIERYSYSSEIRQKGYAIQDQVKELEELYAGY